MKKALTIILAIILVLALAAGCGDKNAGSEESDSGGGLGNINAGGDIVADTGGTAGTTGTTDVLEWPASDLPSGFPEYPDGDISSVTVDDNGDVYIMIDNSDEKTMEAYRATLEEADWVFSETGFGEKEGYTLTLTWLEEFGTVAITVSEHTPAEWNEGWPKDMPAKLPEYPDGTLSYTPAEESGLGLVLVAENTSQATHDKYLDMLIKDGWKLSGARDERVNMLEKNGVSIKVMLGAPLDWVMIIFQ